VIILLLPLILTGLSFGGKAPNCNELSQILLKYEKDLHQKTINNCKEVKLAELINSKATDGKFIEDKLCHNFATIETLLEQKKSELAVLTGIEKLKDTIKNSIEKAKEGSTKGGENFLKSLNTAQSLELILNTKFKDGDSLAEKINSHQTNPDELIKKVNEWCKKNEKTQVDDACDDRLFKPSDESLKELTSLFQKNKPTSENVDKWKKKLEIKKKGEDINLRYSFTEMQKDLKDVFEAFKDGEPLKREHLKKIQELEEFENAYQKSVTTMFRDKDEDPRIMMDRILFSLGDADTRIQYEVQSKLSVFWQEIKEMKLGLTDDQIQNCQKAKEDFSIAKFCYSDLIQVQVKKELEKKGLGKLLDALQVSIDYQDKISKQKNQCENKLDKEKLPEMDCFKNFDEDKSNLSNEILQLNILKDKIGSENQDLITYRNFTLYKWQFLKCGIEESPMDFCESDQTTQTISREALMTAKDSLEIAVLFTPKSDEDEKAAHKLCHDKGIEKRKDLEEKLCEFFHYKSSRKCNFNSEEPSNNPGSSQEEARNPDSTTDSDNSVNTPRNYAKERVRDAWIDGLKNTAAGLTNFFRQNSFNNPMPSTMAPYPYNYVPMTQGPAPMSISESILFNARFHEASGFYTPTPGMPQYSDFNQSQMTGSNPGGNMNKYFNY
jgi:hypothetical protein